MTTRNDTEIICALVSAVVHYQEYIDTGELFDLEAAKGALFNMPLKQWIRHNHVLIPLRRDGKSIAIQGLL
ncbi:MAG: hypothetical protein V3S33_03475 [Gammaproteobacteria bacterium]